MDLQTLVTFQRPSFFLSYEEEHLLLGSCFVENIGRELEALRFRTDLNPFGVLYNPASIAAALRRLLHPVPYKASDLFQRDGIYHSFDHHSRFSSPSGEDCLQMINGRLRTSGEGLYHVGRLIITFGTAYVYRLKSTGQVVANCHKLPEQSFLRTRLTAEEVTDEWKDLLPALWKANPSLKILFTVSPIRHWKDGAHANQLSKSTLLMAIEELRNLFPERTDYFPAYEIMMDELRDYRFYADDMIHPSPLAVRYIWERFGDHYFTEETRTVIKEVEEIERALSHKPFNPGSPAHKRFLMQTLLKMERIREKRPYLYSGNDIDSVRSKMD